MCTVSCLICTHYGLTYLHFSYRRPHQYSDISSSEAIALTDSSDIKAVSPASFLIICFIFKLLCSAPDAQLKHTGF